MMNHYRRITIAAAFGILCLAGMIKHGMAINAIPIPGDHFQFHYELVTQGVIAEEGVEGKKFEQKFIANFAGAVVRNITAVNAWEMSYRYDHFRMEMRIEDATPSVLEVAPQIALLNGKSLYDARTHPDAPPSLLTNLLYEPITAIFSNNGEMLRFVSEERRRQMLPVIDLTQPVQETWMRRPPEPLTLGKTWQEDHPCRLLSNKVTLPASQTCIIQALPQGNEQTVIIGIKSLTISQAPRRIESPFGDSLHQSLKLDALGANINARPGDLIISSLTAQATGTAQYRLDRGFLSAKHMTDKVTLIESIPQADGQQPRSRTLIMNRSLKLHANYQPVAALSEEARMILLQR